MSPSKVITSCCATFRLAESVGTTNRNHFPLRHLPAGWVCWHYQRPRFLWPWLWSFVAESVGTTNRNHFLLRHLPAGWVCWHYQQKPLPAAPPSGWLDLLALPTETTSRCATFRLA